MPDFIEKLYHVTESQYQNDSLKASNLHEHLSMSRSALHYKLKRYLDKSTAEFLTEFRVVKAKDLLLNTTESVKVIAFQVGFRDPNYFSRVFRRHLGESPREFRKKIYSGH